MSRGRDEFERVALPHAAGLLRFARRLTNDAAAAEDLAQEALLLAWRSFHQLRPESNPRAWLFRILLNRFRGEGRKVRVAPVTIRIDEGRRLPSAGDAAEKAEVFEALAQLPAEHREALVLAVIDGFKCREIAEILGVPIGTVMSRLSRARAAMREKLAPAEVSRR